MSRSLRILSPLLLMMMIAVTGSVFVPPGAAEPKQKDPAVERTRKQVKMLDDIYRIAVVLITKHYVNDEDDLPAGSAAIALFDAVKEKGWHEVRLLWTLPENHSTTKTSLRMTSKKRPSKS